MALDVGFLFLLLSQCCLSAWSQSQGDVRLVGGNVTNLGRVQVFFKNQWGTICDRNFAGAANVICHQLNYTYGTQALQGTSTKSLKEEGGHQIENITNSTLIALMDVDCGPIESIPPVTLHILECDYKSGGQLESECSHEDDLAILCETDSTQSPYNSEVRLVGGNFSSIGTLEVYLNKKWGNVCYQGFNQAVADTVCRQIGYTHAERFFGAEKATSKIAWLKDITCVSSQPCLNSCFNEDQFNQTSCLDGVFAAVQCSFDTDQEKNGMFGNPIRCSLQKRYSKTPAYFVAILSVSSLFWVLSSVAVIVMAACFSTKKCPCYKLRDDFYTQVTAN